MGKTRFHSGGGGGHGYILGVKIQLHSEVKTKVHSGVKTIVGPGGGMGTFWDLRVVKVGVLRSFQRSLDGVKVPTCLPRSKSLGDVGSVAYCDDRKSPFIVGSFKGPMSTLIFVRAPGKNKNHMML